MSDEPRFSEADLAPDPEARRAARRQLADRVAAAFAVLAAAAWIGGLVALGACAAPFVFRLTPAPFSGDAMGAAFARFDAFALGAAAVLLAAEVVRTFVARRNARALGPRVRRMAAIVLAGCAAVVALVLTPRINALHQQGARRGEGPEGETLERLHHQAETLGKVQVLLGVAVVFLHVLTLPSRRPEDDDDDDAPAPLAPGPRD